MRAGFLSKRLLVIGGLFWGLVACQADQVKPRGKALWSLPPGGGYRITLNGKLSINTSAPLPYTSEIGYRALLQLRVERVLARVVRLRLTLEQSHLDTQLDAGRMLAPLLARLPLPSRGARLTLWLDAIRGEVLSYETGSGVQQLTPAETKLTGLAVFPLLNEFEPFRIDCPYLPGIQLLYQERTKAHLDGQEAVQSTLKIESAETPLPIGQIKVSQIFSSRAGQPLINRVRAECSTRTRIARDGVRLVLPFHCRLEGVAEYAPL